MGRPLAVGVLLAIAGASLVLVVTTTSAAVLDSASMEPWASPGDLLVHRIVPATDIEVGDVATVPTSDRGLVTHRVVALEDDGDGRLAVLRGDASRFPDPSPVTLRDDVDRVVLVVPRLGTAVRTGGPWLLAGSVLLLVGLLVLGLARRGTAGPVEEPTATTAPPTVLDPRMEALLATCEQLQEDGVTDAVLADVVRVRTAAIFGLPSAERSGAVLSADDGVRFYVLAVADVDTAMLELVPVASERRRGGSAALDAWWDAVADQLPQDATDAVQSWLARTD